MIGTAQFVYDILRDLAKEADSYACVGVQEGNCLRHVLLGNPCLKRLALCDTWGPEHGGTNRGGHAHIEKMLRDLGYNGEVLFLDGDSITRLPELSQNYDLTFVDGGHDEQTAFSDLMSMWPRTSKFMVVHDVHMDSVQAALARFLSVMGDWNAVQYSSNGTGTNVVSR